MVTSVRPVFDFNPKDESVFFHPARLLIVDDEPGIVESLQTIFEDQGYEVEGAATAHSALVRAQRKPFDVALIDYMLPDLPGSEVMRKLLGICPEISCIMMTAYASVENVLAALNLRARGFVLKPIDPPMVVVKVREAVEMQRLERENKSLLAQLQAAYPRLQESYQREHRIAEMLQRALLPSLPAHIGPFEVGDRYQAGLQEAQVGGDIYDVVQLENGRIGILMADVSGKGLDAAVQMGMVHYSTRVLGLTFPDPGDVVRQLHRVLCFYENDSSFISLFYGVFDPVTELLRYVNAGHELPFLVRSKTRDVISLPTTGPVVGVSAFLPDDYRVEECSLTIHDSVFLYTDGLSELRSADQFLGCDQIQHWLHDARDLCPAELVQEVFARAREFSAGVLHDDIALLSLCRRM